MSLNRTYQLQGTRFAGCVTHRVLQDEHHSGPCILLTLTNTYLLMGQISFQIRIQENYGMHQISSNALFESVRDQLIKIKNKISAVNTTNDPKHIYFIRDLRLQMDPNRTHNISEDVTYLTEFINRISTKFQCGFIMSFEDTRRMFQLFALKLYTASNINGLQDGRVAALFHNDHYTTIYKNPEDHVIYELIVDEATVRKYPNCVWRKFNPDHNRKSHEIFLNHNFNVINQTNTVQISNESKTVDDVEHKQWRTISDDEILEQLKLGKIQRRKSRAQRRFAGIFMLFKKFCKLEREYERASKRIDALQNRLKEMESICPRLRELHPNNQSFRRNMNTVHSFIEYLIQGEHHHIADGLMNAALSRLICDIKHRSTYCSCIKETIILFLYGEYDCGRRRMNLYIAYQNVFGLDFNNGDLIQEAIHLQTGRGIDRNRETAIQLYRLLKRNVGDRSKRITLPIDKNKEDLAKIIVFGFDDATKIKAGYRFNDRLRHIRSTVCRDIMRHHAGTTLMNEINIDNNVVIREECLQQQINTRICKRWMKLEKTKLHFYLRETSKNPIKSIDLNDYNEIKLKRQQCAFELSSSSSKNSFPPQMFICSSKQSMKRWNAAISTIHCEIQILNKVKIIARLCNNEMDKIPYEIFTGSGLGRPLTYIAQKQRMTLQVMANIMCRTALNGWEQLTENQRFAALFNSSVIVMIPEIREILYDADDTAIYGVNDESDDIKPKFNQIPHDWRMRIPDDVKKTFNDPKKEKKEKKKEKKREYFKKKHVATRRYLYFIGDYLMYSVKKDSCFRAENIFGLMYRLYIHLESTFLPRLLFDVTVEMENRSRNLMDNDPMAATIYKKIQYMKSELCLDLIKNATENGRNMFSILKGTESLMRMGCDFQINQS